MPTVDVSSLTHQVLWSAFALAAAFGGLARITHFCTIGAIADVYCMGDWRRARMWLLASSLIGGLSFGAGMVLALGSGRDLPSLMAPALHIDKAALALFLGVGLVLLLCALALWRSGENKRELWLAGLGVGALMTVMWWVSGHLGFVPEHPETLEPTYLASNSRHMEALSFVAPAAYVLDWLTMFSDSSEALTLGTVLPLGVVLGSAAAALARRDFRWEGFGGAADTARHLVGTVLMGVGGITAMGCSIGQGLSGLSSLSLGSVLATAGAWAALRWQVWQLERQA